MWVMISSGPLGSHAQRHTDLLLLLGGLFEEVSLKCSSLEIRNNESYFSSLAVKNSCKYRRGKSTFHVRLYVQVLNWGDNFKKAGELGFRTHHLVQKMITSKFQPIICSVEFSLKFFTNNSNGVIVYCLWAYLNHFLQLILTFALKCLYSWFPKLNPYLDAELNDNNLYLYIGFKLCRDTDYKN